MSHGHYRYYSFAGACSLLQGEYVEGLLENVKPNAAQRLA
jgi:hypothetical protein